MSEHDHAPLSESLAAVAAADPAMRDAFAQAFDEVAPALYAWVRSRIPSQLSAMLDPGDVVQETWCRAFARWADYDASRGGLRSWLLGIARNILREVYTHYHRRPWTPSDGAHSRVRGIEGIPDEATAVSMRVARDEAIERFMAVVDGLPAEDRELVVLRGLEELSHDEIATHLGVDPATVRKRWTRLRARLADGPIPDWLRD